MLLIAALLALSPSGSLADVASFAQACQKQERWIELAAIAYVETGSRRHARSGKGACCYMGLLGGRYGLPSCKALEADPDLCLSEAVAHLEYWERHCGESYLDGWNGGWRKCWSRKEVTGSRCKGRCDSYGQKVGRVKLRIEGAVKVLEQFESQPGRKPCLH